MALGLKLKVFDDNERLKCAYHLTKFLQYAGNTGAAL